MFWLPREMLRKTLKVAYLSRRGWRCFFFCCLYAYVLRTDSALFRFLWFMHCHVFLNGWLSIPARISRSRSSRRSSLMVQVPGPHHLSAAFPFSCAGNITIFPVEWLMNVTHFALYFPSWSAQSISIGLPVATTIVFIYFFHSYKFVSLVGQMFISSKAFWLLESRN